MWLGRDCAKAWVEFIRRSCIELLLGENPRNVIDDMVLDGYGPLFVIPSVNQIERSDFGRLDSRSIALFEISVFA